MYWGEFYTVDTAGVSIIKYDNAMTVDQPTENSVNINGSSLEKNGNQINGQMGYTPVFPSANSIIIDAKWKSKNGYYTIEGDFSAVGQTISYFGTFKMGSY